MPQAKCGWDDGDDGAGHEPGHKRLIAHGPSIAVRIGFDPKYVSGNPHIEVPDDEYLALVDTGACESCIDSALAIRLGLPIVDKRTVAGSAGPHQVDVFLAQIYIPSLTYVQHGAFAGVHLEAGGQKQLALIGRTFLRNFSLMYNGTTGEVTIFQ